MPKLTSTFDPAAYAPVAERIAAFYERYPEGRIITELVNRSERDVVFRALVYRSPDDPSPGATGWAAELVGDGDINAVACLENTETSAVGRALANLGFTASRHRASREEMEKAERARRRVPERSPAAERRPPDARLHGPGARSREPDAKLQARADALHDLLDLITLAERRGVRPARARAFRARLLAIPLSDALVQRLERRFRRWVERHPPF